jgi:hypothetical protein
MGTQDYFQLPVGLGGARRDRTADLLHAMQALSQLSYSPNGVAHFTEAFEGCQEIRLSSGSVRQENQSAYRNRSRAASCSCNFRRPTSETVTSIGVNDSALGDKLCPNAQLS